MLLDIGEVIGIMMIGIIFIVVVGNFMILFVIICYFLLCDVMGMFLVNFVVVDFF